MNKFIYIPVVLLIFGLTCCKKNKEVEEETPVEAYDRSELLNNLTDNYITPAYQELSSHADLLATAVNDFNTNPTLSSLNDLRAAWKTGLMSWQSVGMLEFGPGSNHTQRVQLNIFPIDTTLIKDNINNGGYTIDAASNLTAKGFQAIDFLLYGIANNDNSILDLYTTDTDASKRKTYLLDVANNIKYYCNTISTDWSSYASTFKNNNTDNSVGSSIGQFINAYISYFETYLRKGKIGLPSGVFNGFSQNPLPDHCEALYYANSLGFCKEALLKTKAVFKGNSFSTNSSGTGLDDYLDFVDAKLASQDLSDAISNQFDVAYIAIDGLNDPLSNEVQVNQQAVLDAYAELQKLVGYLKTDMTSELGVQITYADNDGD